MVLTQSELVNMFNGSKGRRYVTISGCGVFSRSLISGPVEVIRTPVRLAVEDDNGALIAEMHKGTTINVNDSNDKFHIVIHFVTEDGYKLSLMAHKGK